MRIAYFINQYPAVTHTFIRREIRAVETLGVSVFRYALRPGKNLFDPEDKQEEKRTKFVLKVGVRELLYCCAGTLLTRPTASWGAIRQAIRIGWRSDRGVLRHLAYVVEAAVLARWCRLDGIQHIHAHFGTNSAAIAMFAWQLSGIPYSFTAHGPEEFEKAASLSLDLKLEHAAFAVCVSAFGRSQLMRWSSPDDWQKISIVHCGLDRAYLESTLQPIPSISRLTCVGRLDVEKGQITLVAAARCLSDAGTRFELVLVGDGRMRQAIEDAICRAGLQSQITITGFVSGDRVRAEIAAARALVLPSFAENLPVVIMEAMALGRPVISTYVAGIPELVEPKETGWLVPAGDEIALAEAMREALAAPVTELATMGTNGRLRIVEQHDALKEASKLKRLFETSTGAVSM
jgi:colanic acid/amylovoran biosynthesis glycosyltransferase